MVIAKASEMYRIDPIVSIHDQITLPTCMYKVKNIHGSSISAEFLAVDTSGTKYPDITNQRPYKDLAMLEARQERLLLQLESLRMQMLSMKQNLQSSSVPEKIPKSSVIKNIQKADLPCDVVIKASPSHPPYSLLALQKLINITVSCHTHSTISSLLKDASEFSQDVCKNSSPNPDINITLIWKEVGVDTELITSSAMPVIIFGEVNILRYIVTAVPSQFGYKHLESAWEIDSLLDTCHRLHAYKTVKERQSLLKLLNAKLGKHQWIGGNKTISVVDLAAWSILKEGKYQKDLTVNMKNWIQRCNDYSAAA